MAWALLGTRLLLAKGSGPRHRGHGCWLKGLAPGPQAPQEAGQRQGPGVGQRLGLQLGLGPGWAGEILG